MNSCQRENCNHIHDATYHTDFCECRLCNRDFWHLYKSLFNSEGLSDADLEIDVNVNRMQSKLDYHKVKVCDSDFDPSHPSGPGDLNQQITGAAMTAKLPRLFDVFAQRAFKAGQQPDGLQVPAQWVDLIGGLPMLSDRFHFNLFGQHERCLEIILSSMARVVLAVLTVWPTTLTPTVE